MRKKQHKKRFWFFMGVMFFVVSAVGVFVLVVPKDADLQAVLMGQGLGAGSEPLILFSVFAFTMATISAAKGYELFRHEKNSHQDKLSSLTSENHRIRALNNELQDRVSQTDEQEKLLHKSIMILKEDIEMLLSQNKELSEELNKVKTKKQIKPKKVKRRKKNAKA